MVVVVAAVILLAVGSVPGPAAADARPVAAFVSDGGTVTVLNSDGSTTSLDRSASVVGPMRDYDRDGLAEVPYVDSSGQLSIVDTNGETQTLASGADAGKTTLASGDWDGDGRPAVIYVNSDDNGYLYRVEAGGQPQRILDVQSKGAIGVADYDQDGDRDVVFLGSSSTIKYYDGSTVESTGYSSIGSNNGRGVGPIADFNGNGHPRVPVVDGSNNIALICACGEKTTLNGNYQSAVKAPVGAADWTGDGRLEVMHVNTNNGELAYASLDGETGIVESSGGGGIAADSAAGVAPVLDTTPPSISDYSASNPSDRTLSVSFESSEALSEIEVAIGGDTSVTLTTDDFSESGSGPYTYSATYDVSEDGTYDLALETARSAGGDGASGQSASVTVDTPEPEITDATLSDLTDGDGAVEDGDTVRVAASVSGVEDGSVTADLSELGIGTVTLSESSDGTYAASATVDASSVPDGWVRATVEATNQYDKTARAETNEIALDTSPPTARAGSDRTVTVGESVSFDGGESTDSVDIDRYHWDFDDDITATGKTVVHEYDDPGIYVVTLTVTDVAGHSDDTTVEIEVEDTSRSTRTATETATPTETESGTSTPTETATPTETETATQTTRASTPTETATSSATETVTPTDTETATQTTQASTPTGTAASSQTTVTSVVEVVTVTRRVTVTVSDTATAEPTEPPTATATPSPTSTPTARTATPDDEQMHRAVERFDGMAGNASGGLVAVEARTTADSLDLSTSHAQAAPDGVPELEDRPGIDVVQYVSLAHETPSDAVGSATLTTELERSALDSATPGDVAVYRYDGGSWTRLETTALDTTGQTYRYRAVSPGLSTFAIGTADASLSMVHTTLHDRIAGVGEPVQITAELYNTGTIEGATLLTLSVNGSRTERVERYVPAGERENVTLATKFDTPGSYRLSIDGTVVGTVTVTGDRTRQLNPLGVPRMPGCGPNCDIPLVTLVGLVFGGALFVRRRHRRPERHHTIGGLRNR